MHHKLAINAQIRSQLSHEQIIFRLVKSKASWGGPQKQYPLKGLQEIPLRETLYQGKIKKI